MPRGHVFWAGMLHMRSAVRYIEVMHLNGQILARTVRLRTGEIVQVRRRRPITLGPFPTELPVGPDMLERRFLEIARDNGGNGQEDSCVEQMHAIMAELVEAASRRQLAESHEASARETSACARATAEAVHRVEMGNAVIINRLVNRLGTARQNAVQNQRLRG